jgi:imidazoleglycerol phosphate synthase glutamine amidotransferase subunit HisH|tara:strand:+ start:1009 stop:1155 length:147 start_codon:yes stop_codon:yes gene_type:complete
MVIEEVLDRQIDEQPKEVFYCTKFHPEKIRDIGIKILQNFARRTSSNS